MSHSLSKTTQNEPAGQVDVPTRVEGRVMGESRTHVGTDVSQPVKTNTDMCRDPQMSYQVPVKNN